MNSGWAFSIIMIVAMAAPAQTEDAFEQDEEKKETRGILDPSRFSINHAVSFGMGTSSGSSLQSQSLYSTMIRYEITKPVTLNLNFGLPIHSTYSSSGNLTMENIESLDYFKSMPFDVSMTVKPNDRFMFRLGVARREPYDPYANWYAPPGSYRNTFGAW